MSTSLMGFRETWGPTAESKEQERLFHMQELQTQVLPFWIKSFDEQYGGVYTCYSNDGEQLLSDDKFTWSQGRMLWLLSALLLAQRKGHLDLGSNSRFLAEQAGSLYRFLHNHALLEKDEGVTAFVLDRVGKPKEQSASQGYYTSFYADCFVVMGFAKYAMLTGERLYADEALLIYNRMQEYLGRGDIRTEPYPLPDGCSTQAVSMILCNTCKELSDCFALFDTELQTEFLHKAQHYGHTILTRFYDEKRNLLYEILPSEEMNDTVLARHYNPGHAIECMWFCLDCLDDAALKEQMAALVLSSLKLGWDHENGGLLRYVDRDGGQPKGRDSGTEFEKLIQSTWDYKLWWPHAEALYSCLRFYEATGNEEFYYWYEKLKKYTYSVFPSSKGMEWIQITTRDGKALERVVALPVKDPYHILRMHLLSIQLLAEEC